MLTNADFAKGKEGWWSGTSKAMVAAGCRQGPEEGRWVAHIPAAGCAEPTGILFGHAASLLPGKTYRLSYTLTTEKAGTMRHIYQLSQRPWTALGLAEDVPVPAGTTKVVAAFLCTRPDETTAAHLTLNLSRLAGKVSVGDIRLEEVVRLPVSALASSWTVFLDVGAPPPLAAVPASLPAAKGSEVAPRHATLEGNAIDLAALNGGIFRTRARAVLCNEFVVEGPAVMRLGLAADWWMEIQLNGQTVHSTMAKGNGSQAFSPNDHVVDLPLAVGRNVLVAQVLSGSKGWRFVCGTPDPPVAYAANEEWKAADMGRTQIQAGSALDLSAQVPAPAGRLGRLTVGPQGDLVFADDPERPLRMLGFNGSPASMWQIEDDGEFRARVRQFAQSARRQGYCLFRVHGDFDRRLCIGAETDLSIQPGQLDRWDYLLAELKREGIYCHLVIFSFGLYQAESARARAFEERDKYKLHLYLGAEWERQHFRYGAETVLNHVNPYTGLAWKDDPAIAFVEFYNEQELGLDRMGKTLDTFPETRAFLEREWRAWLVARHGERVPAPLLAELAGKPLGEAPLPRLNDRGSELANEFALFRMHIGAESARWCEKVVRGTGYAGLTTQYNASKKLGESLVRWRVSQVVDMHSYYRHPVGGWGTAGNSVEQSSSLADAGGYWRNANSTRLSGRPFIVSEFNHCFWNPYQHEGGLVFGAYSALQGTSALEIHSGPVTLGVSGSKVGSFTCGASPVVRASEFLSACLYQRGDVARSSRRVELVVPQEVLERGCTALGAVSTEQSKLALMTGFSVAFPWAEGPSGLPVPSIPAMRVLPSGVAAVDAQDWFVNVVESKDGSFSLAGTVAAMKERGILGPGNASDPEAGVFESDTGEIVMRSREHLLKVRTPRTEAVTLEAGKAEELGVLRVEDSSVPACVAACSVDGRPLSSSRRAVLVYSTEMVNTGMIVSPDRQVMIDTGRSPALMRCGRVRLSLGCERPEDLALYALGYDGSRRERLPTTVVEGVLHVAIDTATLADGPTPFFELVAAP